MNKAKSEKHLSDVREVLETELTNEVKVSTSENNLTDTTEPAASENNLTDTMKEAASVNHVTDAMEIAASANHLTYTIEEAGKERMILKGIDCVFEQGKIYTISGPSGSGKTTFLYALAGLLDNVQGSVRIGGTELLKAKRRARDRIRLEQIGMVFQNLNLFDFMNVEDNILMPYYLRRERAAKYVYRQIAKYLDLLKLGQIQKKNIASLSGGEQQRVAIIRAIVSNPKLILCDEPTASLDSENVRIFMEALRTLQRESGSTIVIVTHDARVVAYGDEKIRIVDGQLYR